MPPVDLFQQGPGGMSPAPMPNNQPTDVFEALNIKPPLSPLETAGASVSRFANQGSMGLGNKIAAALDAMTFHGSAPTFGERYDKALRELRGPQEQLSVEHPNLSTGADISGTLSGYIGGAGLLKPAAGLGKQIVQGMKVGGAFGGGQAYGDSSNEGLDAAKETLQGTAAGAIGGGATVGALGTLGKIAAPEINTVLDKIRAYGGKPSMGQIGDFVETENTIGKFPGLSTINTAHKSTRDAFYRATLDEALAPIGETIDKSVPNGTQAVAHAAKKLEGIYNKFGDVKGIAVDPVRDFAPLSADLTASEQETFAKLIKTEVTDKLTDGTMTGATWKAARAKLGDLADNYEGRDGGEAMSNALQGAQGVLHEALANSVPEAADLLKNANQTWLRLNVVKRAATYASSIEDKGIFNPETFLKAVRGKGGETRFAEGRAPMQPYAQSMYDALGASEKLQSPLESFTATRMGEWPIGQTLRIPYGAAQAATRVLGGPRPEALRSPTLRGLLENFSNPAAAEAGRVSPLLFDKPNQR